MPLLNVVYGRTHSRIKTDGIEDISELRRAIKAEYNAMDEIDAPELQLYKSFSDKEEKAKALITDLDDISAEYFEKLNYDRLALEIQEQYRRTFENFGSSR
jgi:hypothetical protein